VSLLIDALKKAEQEKKEAAKRLKEAQEKAGEHYQLESRTQDQPSAPGPGSEQEDKIQEADLKIQEPSTSIETPTANDLSMSSVDDEDRNKDADITQSHDITGEEEIPSALELKDVTLENPEIPDEGDDQELQNEDLIAPGADQTFALVGLSNEEQASPPFEETANATLTGKYSKTISDTRVSRSPVSAAELASDMGGGKEIPTPVAAQTVFSAVASSAGRRQAFEWVAFLVLFTMIVLAAGSFYYLKITPLTPETSSPLVAKGIETNQSTTIDMSLPEIITPAEQPEAIIADTTRPSEQDLAVTDKMTDEVPPQPDTEIKSMTEEPATPVAEAAEQKVAVAGPADQGAAIKTDILEFPEEIKVESAAIAISRSRSVKASDQLINSAYAQYIAGNYTGAEAEYRKVLEKLPESRDALLGIAAIAYRKGDLQNAYENYLKVIKYYPKDAAARTALINMQGRADPVKSESLIKLMIQEEPAAAFLYFTLGNIYAKQSRWADAQQAFFEAYRNQPTNPDYALNLAVSLDHIGQAKAALDYYNKALELADESQVSFNTASVMTRINTLATTSN